jgi:hypothetical protein
MEKRFVVLAEGPDPKIYMVPANQTARLRNEIPGRKVEVFEAFDDARKAALAIVEQAKANARPRIEMFSIEPNRKDEEQLKTLSELTEDRVERYPF